MVELQLALILYKTYTISTATNFYSTDWPPLSKCSTTSYNVQFNFRRRSAT